MPAPDWVTPVPELRPLEIGEILDVSLKVYRSHFTTLVKVVAAVIAPLYVLSAIVQGSARSSGGVTGSDRVATLGAALVVFIILLLGNQVATGAAFRAVGAAYLGNTPDWRESLRYAFARVGSLLWAGFLVALFAGLGFLACILPGIYLIIAFSLVTPILMLEDSRGLKALSRSRDLIKGRWFSVFATLVLGYVLIFIFQFILRLALAGLIINTHSGDGIRILVNAIVSIVSGALTTPFLATLVTVVYFDERVRNEGFDLDLLAQRMGVDPPPPSAPGPFRV